MTEPTEDRCPKCNRGRESCEWCHDLTPLDYETVCDCGLYDFGHHLLDCSTTTEEQWVIRV